MEGLRILTILNFYRLKRFMYSHYINDTGFWFSFNFLEVSEQ